MKSRLSVFRSLLSIAACAAVLTACGGGGGGSSDDADHGSGTTSKPPAWGSLTVTGSNEVAKAIPRVTPNAVPKHEVNTVDHSRAVFWVAHNGYDARDTVEPPAPALASEVVVVTNMEAPGPLVGILSMSLRVNAYLPDERSESTVVYCGGSGDYADLQRDAACERITFDPARRALHVDHLVIANTDIVIDGELRYPDLAPRAETTAKASSFASCPLTTGEVTLTQWSSTACFSGDYRGISDSNKPCTLSVDPTAQTVRVDIDGYRATYAYPAIMDGRRRELDHGIVQKSWEYGFTVAPNDGTNTSDAQDAVLVSFTDLASVDTSAGPMTALSVLAFHTTAPEGVSGPVDIKTCSVSVR